VSHPLLVTNEWNRIMTVFDWLIIAVIAALIIICGAAMWVIDRRRR
jgi:hypothetical protein